jgi:hypothetical protein
MSDIRILIYNLILGSLPLAINQTFECDGVHTQQRLFVTFVNSRPSGPLYCRNQSFLNGTGDYF